MINRRSTSSFSWDDFFLGFEIEGDRLTPVENIPKIGYFEETPAQNKVCAKTKYI
jgi:hypothetical protein